jgi:FixJ family two-component response regulator
MINIVENDQNIREGYRMLLKSTGFECNCFETAEDFLKNLPGEETDLLLLDIHLNGINGFTILEYLKNKGLHVPVIIISSLDNQESRKLAKSYGALAYLRKPIDSEALIDIIKYNLDAQNTKESSTYL